MFASVAVGRINASVDSAIAADSGLAAQNGFKETATTKAPTRFRDFLTQLAGATANPLVAEFKTRPHSYADVGVSGALTQLQNDVFDCAIQIAPGAQSGIQGALADLTLGERTLVRAVEPFVPDSAKSIAVQRTAELRRRYAMLDSAEDATLQALSQVSPSKVSSVSVKGQLPQPLPFAGQITDAMVSAAVVHAKVEYTKQYAEAIVGSDLLFYNQLVRVTDMYLAGTLAESDYRRMVANALFTSARPMACHAVYSRGAANC